MEYQSWTDRVFGDDPSKSAMSRRLQKVPELWPDLLGELWAFEPEDKRRTQDRVRALACAVRQASADAWKRACAKGLVTDLAEITESRFLCGFTREHLMNDRFLTGFRPGEDASPDDDNKFIRVALILELFSASVSRALKNGCPDLKDVLQHSIVDLYAKLWDLKDSFLTGKVRDDGPGSRGGRRPVDIYTRLDVDALHNTLIDIGEEVLEHSDRNDGIFQLRDSHIRRVFLYIWVHSFNSETRKRALSNIIYSDAMSSRRVWSDLFSDATDGGCTGTEDITDALLRDLADEENVHANIYDTRALLDAWDKFNRSRGKNLSVIQPKLPQLCIAAACRQLCRGDESDIVPFMTMAHAVFDSLRTGWIIAGTQRYAVLDLLCRYTVLRLQDASTPDDDFVPKQLTQFTESALGETEGIAQDSSPAALAMRRHTLRAWGTVNGLLAEHKRLPKWNAAWRGFAQLWPLVKARIPPAPNDDEAREAPFQRLRRCGWDMCLCSRHAPAHKMRVCKRCRRVAYCGEQCQKKDWGMGGHKMYCRERGT